MFKGFQSKSCQFNGFPNLNFQVNNEAYGFTGCTFWLDAGYGLNTQTNLAAVTLWKDKIRGIEYTQNTVANQPRLITADVNFNNNPIIDFNTAGKVLSVGNSIIVKQGTIAVVYQYISSATGTSYASRLIGDGDQSNVRTNGKGFYWNRNNNSSILNSTGFYNGGMTAVATSTNEYVTSQRIAIINANGWYANGTAVTLTTGTIDEIVGFELKMIGGINATFAGVFKIAEIIQYAAVLDSANMIVLSDRLNLKYAIY